MRFVAVDDVFVDVVGAATPSAGERLHADVTLRAGGSAVNAALCAAALGASATVVGRVGVDPAGDLVAESLRVEGVTPRLARDDELPTGVAVALFADGQPGVVAARGANARLTPADIPEPLEADALFVSGFALLHADSASAAWAAFDRFDGHWAGVDLAAPGLAAQADLDAISGSARVVFATAAEARAATGAEPEDAVRELASSFAVVCVKLGAAGALAAEGDVVEHRAAPPVERLRPFGAGDAFAAAFLIARAGGEQLGDALEQACAAGARAA